MFISWHWMWRSWAVDRERLASMILLHGFIWIWLNSISDTLGVFGDVFQVFYASCPFHRRGSCNKTHQNTTKNCFMKHNPTTPSPLSIFLGVKRDQQTLQLQTWPPPEGSPVAVRKKYPSHDGHRKRWGVETKKITPLWGVLLKIFFSVARTRLGKPFWAVWSRRRPIWGAISGSTMDLNATPATSQKHVYVAIN